MAIGVLFEFPGATKAQYEAVEKQMTKGGQLRKLADWPVNKGLIAHMAGPTPAGWRVVDVWESEADFMNFAAYLMPLAKAAGFPDTPPQIFPLHNFVKG